jgi:indole-3-acetate monooxygenase
VTTDPVEAARELAQRAAELAERTEGERRLPPELSEAIAERGLYRLCVPGSLGGGEAHPRVLVEAVEALAQGDAAAGWCVAICATSGMLAAYLPDAAAAEVYGDPLGVVGGVFAPMGRAAVDGDSYVVDGRWRFASNVEGCDWLMGGCAVLDGGEVRTLPSGRPDIRLVLFPRADVRVIDTWSVSGLRGTGSHSWRLRRATQACASWKVGSWPSSKPWGCRRGETPARATCAGSSEEMKASGFIADALRRNGQGDAIVAPPSPHQ